MRRTLPRTGSWWSGISIIALTLTVALSPPPTSAQVSESDDSTSVGTSSALCVAAIGQTKAKGGTAIRPAGLGNTGGSLTMQNTGSNDIWYAPNIPGISVGVGALGSRKLPSSGGLHYWPAGSAPKNGMNCIANGGSSNLTVIYGSQ